jgi:hypothetical protein
VSQVSIWPLLRGAVRPALGRDLALRLALDRVVADRRGGAQPFFDVTRIEPHLAGLGLARDVVAPDAREAVGLQLHAHRQLVGLGLARALLRGAHLLVDAEQVLHVMADLVRDHVGLREVARRAEAPLELVVEAQVDVDPLVGRTVERTDGRGVRAARGLYGAGEQREPRLRVLAPELGAEHVAPHRLGAEEHRPHELAALVGGGWRVARHRLFGRRGLGGHAPRQHRQRIAAHEVHEQHQAEQAAQSHAAEAHGTASTPEPPAAEIVDVLAALRVLPPHGIRSFR